MMQITRISDRSNLRMIVFAVITIWTEFAFAQDQSIDTDRISALVEELSTSNSFWNTGFSPVVDLPGDTSVEEVITRLFDEPIGSGRVLQFEILEMRDVQLPIYGEIIPASDVVAVLVHTNLGPKILLLRFNESTDDWWTRVYDASDLRRDVPGIGANQSRSVANSV